MQSEPDDEAALRARLTAYLAVDRFPRASAYDPIWLTQNQMGPNVLWLIEYLSQAMDLRPGMRVLDMGCGKGMSSIFLARELGVDVWATDLWINADENWRRIQEAGLEGRIMPIHAEAHALPFAHDFFDAAVSTDSYHYYGTDDLYLGYYARFIKPGGQMGIVAPGIVKEVGTDIPAHLLPHWMWDFCSFHSPAWWRTHWEKTGLVDVTIADWMPEGGKLWLMWEEMWEKMGMPGDLAQPDLLRADAGEYLGFTRIVARRREMPRYASFP